MYGSQYATILPGGNEAQNLAQINQMMERQRREQMILARQQQEREDEYLKLAMNELDFKRFGTGTPVDGVINSTLSNGIQSIAQKIKSGDTNLAGVLLDAQKIAGEATDYSIKAKQLDAQLKQAAEEYKKDGIIDGNRLYQGAKMKAFMKVNPETGEVTVKAPDEIDPSLDYAAEYLASNPEDVVTSNDGFLKFLSGMKGMEDGSTVTTRNRVGDESKFKYSGTLMPWQERLVDEENKSVVARTKREKVKVGDQELEIMDTPTFNMMFGDNSRRAFLEASFRKELKARNLDPKQFEPEQYELLKRNFALQMLDGTRIGGGYKVEDVEKQKVAPNYILFPREGGSGSSKVNPIEAVLRGAEGDTSFIGSETEEYKGKTLYRLDPYIPGSILLSGKVVKSGEGPASADAFAGVFVDRSDGSIWVKDVEMRNGKPRKDPSDKNKPLYEYRRISAAEEKQWVKKIAAANKVAPEQAEQIWDRVRGSSATQRSAAENFQRRQYDSFLRKALPFSTKK